MFQLRPHPLLDDYYLSVVLVGLALLALLLLGPARSRTTPARRAWLAGIRAGVIVLVILVMLRPTIEYTETKKQSATLIVLVDRSRSMTVPDVLGNKTRWQALGEAVHEALPALSELAGDLEIKVYGFDAEAQGLDFAPGKLDLGQQPAGQQTAIGSVLEDVLRREAGKRLAGVILLSDGAQRAYAPRDTAPQTPTRQLKDLGYPLYTVVFGQSSGLGQVRDVALQDLQVEPTVFVKNQLPVSGKARIEGFSGQPITVQLLWESAPGEMESVAAAQVTATRDGDLLPIELSHTPESPGEYRLTLKAQPQQGESVTTNNELTTYVTVLKGGLNALYLEGRLSPEQKFLRRTLGESQDIKLDLVRIDAERPETHPPDLAERLKPGHYDVYILGDLDSTAFKEGELETLRDTVEQGAGLIALGGIQSFGPGGYDSTPLADCLPVQMDRLDRQTIGAKVRTDVHLPGPLSIRPTQQGLAHFVMLLGTADETARAWRELPPLDGANKLKKKAAATVLAEASGGQPLLLADNFGRGRVLAFAGDSTWRWWLAGKADVHRRFWRQVVLWLARKDQTTDNTVWVELDQRRFAPGSRVEFSAGARNPQGEPIDDALLTAEVVLPDKSRRPLRLGHEAGLSTGVLLDTQAAGEYTLSVTATRAGQTLGHAEARFLVFEQDLELDNPAADPSTMASLAAMTGGRALPPEQLPQLLEELKKYPQKLEIKVQTKSELYDNPLVLALLVVLLGVEWFLRKKWGLV